MPGSGHFVLRGTEGSLPTGGALGFDLALHLGEADLQGLGARVHAHELGGVGPLHLADFFGDLGSTGFHVGQGRVIGTGGGAPPARLHGPEARFGHGELLGGHVEGSSQPLDAGYGFVLFPLRREHAGGVAEGIQALPTGLYRRRQPLRFLAGLGQAFSCCRAVGGLHVLPVNIHEGIQGGGQLPGLGAGGLQLHHLCAIDGLCADHLPQPCRRIAPGQGLARTGQSRPYLLEEGAAGKHLDLGQQFGRTARDLAATTPAPQDQGCCPRPGLGAARHDLHPGRGTELGRPQEIPQQAGDHHDQEDHGKNLQAPPVATQGGRLGIGGRSHVLFEGCAQG